MKEQSQSDRSKLGKCEQNEIENNCNIGMQRMKIDAAAIGIVNGIGYQVIEIHGHCQRHQQPSLPPAILEKKDCNQSGNQQV